MKRRSFLIQATAYTTVFSLPGYARAQTATFPSVVIEWNRALTSAIAATRTQATVAARACSMVNEAIYNAWAGYDAVAAFTLTGLRRQSSTVRSNTTKAIAICHAAHKVLVDLFPTQRSVFDNLLSTKTPSTSGVSGGTGAISIGQSVGTALLQSRHNDGANQLGNLAAGAYSDYTNYTPLNTPDALIDATRWQPLRLVDTSGATVVQQFLTPHWYRVRPFAMWSGSAFRPAMSHRAPTLAEINELVAMSAALDDTTKSLVDFWAANPGTVSPPGQWIQVAEEVSKNDRNTLDKDVKLFFGIGQAVLDASIAAWDSKRYYDSVRPITTIRNYFRNQTIRAWGGTGMGTQYILGQNWRPYQRTTNPTPPFPEFVSGHSTFSQASASVLGGIRASDGIRLTGTVKAFAIGVEGNATPVRDITFVWNSLPEAAASAGVSRRHGGIHFENGDLRGRDLGRSVGDLVLAKCRALFEGRNV